MSLLATILRNEANPSLFHQSTGALNPVSQILELSVAPEEFASMEEGLDREISISEYLAALMHERHHWLQLVSTNSGIFIDLLLEMQAGLASNFTIEGGLDVSSLPLLDTADPSGAVIQQWTEVECARRTFFGARTGDLSKLWELGYNPRWEMISDMLGEASAAAFSGTPAEESVRRMWETRPSSQPLKGTRFGVFRNSGWAVGARHFMECSARINELLALSVDLLRRGLVEWVDSASMYSGIYGMTRNLFYQDHGEPSIEKEVALAYLCDRSLNTTLPPVIPLSDEAIHDGLFYPILPFIVLSKNLKGFDFKQGCDVRDPDAVDGYCKAISTHLESSDLGELLYSIIDPMAADLYSNVDPRITANDIYAIGEHGWPMSIGLGSRYSYFRSCCARTNQIRKEHPGFFVLPVTWYLHDRKLFHSLFDQIQPPLVSYGPKGIFPTRTDRGWLPYFLSASIQYHILRGMMFDDVETLGRTLQPLLNSGYSSKIGVAVMRQEIFDLFGESRLGSKLSEAVLGTS